MQKLKIATIGAFGHLGRVLKELDDAGPDWRVGAMAATVPDEDPQAYRREHPSARQAELFDDYRTMLDRVRPDVAIISTRLDLIAPIAIEAAQRGCHLICEKPLAIEEGTLRRLWETCRLHRVQCIAILNNHVHPVLVAARAAVAQGRIGRVVLFNAHKSYKWGQRPEWFGRREFYGGTIPWIGIHALDFIYSITQQPFVSVAAMHSNLAHPDRPQCEDNCALILRLADGTHATASLDLLRPASADTHGEDRLRIVGAEGMIEANLTRHTCALITANQPASDLHLPPPSGCFVAFLRNLASGTGGAEPSQEMVRAFLLTHASLRARAAADDGVVTSIDPNLFG